MINQFQKHGYNRSLIERQPYKLTGEKTTFERKKERHCYNYSFNAQI